jgi:lipopolysaccharide export system protein LptA
MIFRLRPFALASSLVAAGFLGMTGVTEAQEARIAFGDLAQDTTLPVEVTAETFAVNNADGSAVFTGNVVVTQGEMKLSAAEVRVQYNADQTAIDQLVASGGVTIVNLADAAEALEAVYTIATGVIVLTGDVLMTQGPSAMAGQKLTVNLKDGTGVMEGGVTTTFVPGGN